MSLEESERDVLRNQHNMDADAAAQDNRHSASLHPLWNVVFPPQDMGVSDHFSRDAAALYGVAYSSRGDNLGIDVLHDWFVNRSCIRVPSACRFSSAGYFNAFPAAYWSKWTRVHCVVLRLRLSNEARVTVWQSNSRAQSMTVASQLYPAGSVVVTVDIASLQEGGWLWFEVEAEEKPVIISDAAWCSDTNPVRETKVSLAITTMNKPDWCIRQFKLIAQYADMRLINRIIVVDQGTQHVEDAPDFEELSTALDARVNIIHQANIGGSGGFSRGMFEVLQQRESDYVMLLDDDTVIEPESISRAVAFAQQCPQPTIVGGNMLFLTEPTRLCSLAETYNAKGVFWQNADGTPEFPDVTSKPFTEQRWLHKRVDADYNAWWLCMIPARVIERVGLAYPFFIKNDDVEYGVRAQSAGTTTVTVPGICLWHQSWFDKNDILDWQAYFHIRNKIIMGLLHSPYPCGGGLFTQMLKASASATVKMRYSAVDLHIMAVEDILKGPDYIGSILDSRIHDIRSFLSTQPDAQTQAIEELPRLIRERSPKQVQALHRHKVLKLLHQLTPTRANARRIIDGYVEPTKIYGPINPNLHPGEFRVMNIDPEHYRSLKLLVDNRSDHWTVMSSMDSAMTIDVDKRRGTLLVRRPVTAAVKLAHVSMLYMRLACQWNSYRHRYRESFSKMTSMKWWQQQFHE